MALVSKPVQKGTDPDENPVCIREAAVGMPGDGEPLLALNRYSFPDVETG
jgi:hypothetical protein